MQTQVGGAAHLNRDAGVLSVVAKHTHASALGELAALIIEVLSDADGLHERPVLARAQQRGREDDGVEGHIVLAHELHQVHILGVLPPRLLTHTTTSCPTWPG